MKSHVYIKPCQSRQTLPHTRGVGVLNVTCVLTWGAKSKPCSTDKARVTSRKSLAFIYALTLRGQKVDTVFIFKNELVDFENVLYFSFKVMFSLMCPVSRMSHRVLIFGKIYYSPTRCPVIYQGVRNWTRCPI